MPAATQDTVTLDQVRTWAPAVNVELGAQALGVSRSALYQAIAEGTCPVATITVGSRIKILTHSLIAVLEGRPDEGEQLNGNTRGKQREDQGRA